VLNTINNCAQKGEEIDVPVLSATLRHKVCDILISKTIAAAKKFGFEKIVVAGGVSANSELRQRLKETCGKEKMQLFYPSLKYCGDNAAMVGVQAFYEFEGGKRADSSLNAFATMDIRNN
jgi:N6-L-threonylcarbamoyladenine synthase